MIYIRTDSNKIIATGHMMRCITIAQEIINLGGEVCFIVSDDESLILLRDKEFKVIVMHTKWNYVDVEFEYAKMKTMVENGDVLLVDSYFIRNEYLKKMRGLFKVATFDDMFSEKKSADIIINYNVFYRDFEYSNRYKNENCKLLLGEKYVPLRNQFSVFSNLNKSVLYDFPVVLIMCGGGDRENLILTCLNWIKKNNKNLFERIKWKVVIGGYYSYKPELTLYSHENANIEIYENIKNMAELMDECNICITAASTVLYECCARCLPTLFVIAAKDQKYDAKYFSMDDMMLYCGDYLNDKIEALEKILQNLKLIIEDKDLQKKMKMKMEKFTDGYGAKRIADELMKL